MSRNVPKYNNKQETNTNSTHNSIHTLKDKKSSICYVISMYRYPDAVLTPRRSRWTMRLRIQSSGAYCLHQRGKHCSVLLVYLARNLEIEKTVYKTCTRIASNNNGYLHSINHRTITGDDSRIYVTVFLCSINAMQCSEIEFLHKKTQHHYPNNFLFLVSRGSEVNKFSDVVNEMTGV